MKLVKQINMWQQVDVDKGKVLAKAYILQQEVRIEFSYNHNIVKLTRPEARELIEQLTKALDRLMRFD